MAFWKNAYTKAEDEQSKLNNRIYELEQRVESLKGKLKDGSPERGKREGNKDFALSEPRGKRQRLEQLDDTISRLRSEESGQCLLLSILRKTFW